MDAFWQLFLRSVPGPLRITLMSILAFLVIGVQATKMVRQMDYRDVLLDSPFLVGFALSLGILAVQFFLYLKRPWSIIAVVFLVTTGTFITHKAWVASRFIYNDQGFFCYRHWVVEPSEPNEQRLSMQIVAASNTPAKLIIQVETRSSVCPGVVITHFQPILPSDVELEGAQTIEPLPNVRQYTFEKFRRPEKIFFYLTLSKTSNSVTLENCFVSSATSDIQSKPESTIGEGKND